MGSMNALFRMGTKESNCYVRGITNLDTAEVGLFGGAALRTHQYAFNFEIDALNPSHKINATGVYRVGENITIGARYRTVAGAVGPQTKQVLDTKLSLRNESLDSVNAQPQDYEITASVLDNGTTLSTAYLYNMMMPIGGRLHRFSMGGEFVRHGTENVLVETKARMGLTAPRVPSRLLPRSPEPPRSPRPASWAPGTKGYERQLRSSSAAPNKDAGSGSTSMRPRSESAAVEPRELQHNQYVSRTNPSSHHLTAGVSWQPSEAIMIKLRADQATNVGVLLALKTWARNGPNVTVALSMRVNAQNPNAYRAGMFVDFHN
ncbi:hypothetical protein SARC_03411 [Sphaeroforma arctica JP610]|uniref:Uncharacterized protein n=1 Tax=Sphaeroforma arctica JP610 TaxID=667725 RepID=A0A0L0G678_9EUKA|nr:hypothetical protein SARC_03411 [Sphaeroforma arctica JP610]KNC84366.1 hypothetical protein SARC_03411 [Sphaeroforma arctica JP610]|eukprot:XP_014158268.1 hypothetical protein SARC_03411 [Sphaeroforma arctica JP610]